MDVHIREFDEEDIPALVGLLNDANEGSYEFVPLNEQEFRSWIQNGKLEVLMAEKNEKVLGSAAYSNGFWGEEIRWLAVVNYPSRKLAETLLLQEIEGYVKGETVFVAVDAGTQKVDEWVERDYVPQKGLYHMIARLNTKTPFLEPPEGTIIRSLRKEEEEKFVDAVNIGFGKERVKVGDIQRWKTDSPPFDEKWIHIAELDHRIVSAVVSKPDTEYNKSFGGKRGYLGPAATIPECREKNLASALTHRAMSFLSKKGMDSVALYTSEKNAPSINLLKRLGFQIGHHWTFMLKVFKGAAKGHYHEWQAISEKSE